MAISPADALAGLGGADRDLLAACLALFDDSALDRRIQRRAAEVDEAVRDYFSRSEQDALEEEEDAGSVHETRRQWLECEWSDSELRLYLWIQLRAALDLPPRLSASARGCAQLGDDLTATLITRLDPPGPVKSSKRWLCRRGWLDVGEQATTLADIVVPVIDELIEEAQDEGLSTPDRRQRQRELMNALAKMSELTEADHQAVLRETGVNDANDRAIRDSLLLGGSLSLLGTGVGAAGFSSYILAAQISAFVPLVSGPALVSLVSVLASPITILGVSGAGAWGLISKAQRQAGTLIAARVVALLTIHGLRSGKSGLHTTCESFRRLPGLIERGVLTENAVAGWLAEWRFVEPLLRRDKPAIPPAWVFRKMDSVVDDDLRQSRGPKDTRRESSTGDERVNAVAMGGLIAGDVLYSAAAIDPTVIKAADFSRVDDIKGHVDFSQLANEVLSGSDAAVQGSINQLSGYVAERAVAGELASAGHTVSLPDASNQAGYDLLVDGQPFQVKFQADGDAIGEHFTRYDYPVIANAELAETIPEELQDQVFFVDGLSNELIDQITEQSLEAGEAMLDPAAVMPAGLVSTTRGAMAYRRGQVSGGQALEQVLLDGSVRASLAVSASYVGSSVGTLIFGPAGGLVFASGLPAIAATQSPGLSKQVKTHLRGKIHREWEDVAHLRLDALRDAALRGLATKEAVLTQKMNATPNTQAGSYVLWRLEDERRHAEECQARIRSITRDQWDLPQQRAAELLRWLAFSGIHPRTYQQEMRAVVAVIQAPPGISALVNPDRVAEAGSEAKNVFNAGWTTAKDRAARGFKAGKEFISRRQRPGEDDHSE